MVSIAIDLGGTKIKMGVVETGQILAWSSIDAYSDKGLLERLPIIEQHVNSLLDKTGKSKSEVAGVAFATPGLVDTDNMRLISINDKFSDALDFDFKMWAKMRWGTQLVLENDARSALAGEWQYGAGKGYDNVVGLTLGTGIGTSAVIKGQLLRGKHFQAGILGGHFVVNVNGTPCNCGNIGCAEAEASTWSLAQKAHNAPEWKWSPLAKAGKIDYKNVFEWARKGDELADRLMKHSLDIWAATVINMVHAYDPTLVILNGGVMGSADVIIPYIQNKVNKHAWLGWEGPKIVKAENMNNAALLGAAYLASIQNQ